MCGLRVQQLFAAIAKAKIRNLAGSVHQVLSGSESQCMKVRKESGPTAKPTKYTFHHWSIQEITITGERIDEIRIIKHARSSNQCLF